MTAVVHDTCAEYVAQPRLLLERIDKGDFNLRMASSAHYSRPGGFVGRFIAYAIYYGGEYLGVIVGGSATMHLKGRDAFFCLKQGDLNRIVNNSLFHIEKTWDTPPFAYVVGERGVCVETRRKPYPVRNITTLVLETWREQISQDWQECYGDEVLGFETLVQPPRTGELYRRDGWQEVARTKGWTCRRTGGKSSSESFGGRRVWVFDPSQSKIVFCRRHQE